MTRGGKQLHPKTLSERELLALIPVVLRAAGLRAGTASVSFLPNRELRALKWRYLHARPRFVNVLAFPHPEGFPTPQGGRKRYLGEVYLNEAYRRDSGELIRMFVHGMLHLAGFHHERVRDTIVMERLEARIVKKILRLVCS